MKTSDRDKLGELLSAYVDGELSDAQRADVEARVSSDGQAQAALGRLQETANLVSELPRRAAPSMLSDEITARLEREQLIGPEATAPDDSFWRRRWLRPFVFAAAVIVVAITIGLLDTGPRRGGDDPGALALSDRRSTDDVARQPELESLSLERSDQQDFLEAKEPPAAVSKKTARDGVPADAGSINRSTEERTISTADTFQLDAKTEHLTFAAKDDSRFSQPASDSPKDFAAAPAGTRLQEAEVLAQTVQAPDLRMEVVCADQVDLGDCKVRFLQFIIERNGVDTVSRISDVLERAADIEWMVQLPRDQLGDLVDLLAAGGAAKREIALSHGATIQARGLDQAHELVDMLAKGDQVEAKRGDGFTRARRARGRREESIKPTVTILVRLSAPASDADPITSP